MSKIDNTVDWQALADLIDQWAQTLGFSATGITDTELESHGARLKSWLAKGYHGDMSYMGHHGDMRSQPTQLHPGTQRVISLRLDYLSADTEPLTVLDDSQKAYVSRYALGRDYHKVIRAKLKKIVKKIADYLADRNFEEFDARVFTDSAPLLEKAIAEKAGLGWIGKNTLLLNEKAGSWFFLGEILTNLPLPLTNAPQTNRCGSCSACMTICPTDAIVAPYELDARRCISYLTIEHRGAIPEPLRKPMGNRIFGCDDCQLVCPWNRYARFTDETDFAPRHGLDAAGLVTLLKWTESDFLKNTEGSAIRRTGYQGWLRNIAIGLGNSAMQPGVTSALEEKKGNSDLVDEHLQWALAQHSEPINH